VGYETPVNFECELVLQENDHETRRPHLFLDEIQPGTFLRLEGQDWIVMDVRGKPDGPPEIVCRPASERS
jgi:hypothetical protein